MAVPTVRAVGAIASGTGAISPGLPTGTAAGDLLLMLLESNFNEAVTASGWTEVFSSRNEGTTRLTLLEKTAAGGDATTTNDPGDHVIGRILGITTGTWDTGQKPNWAVATDIESTSDTSASIAGPTIPCAECLAVFGGTSGFDAGANGTAEYSAFANSNLSSITERIDNARTDGAGGTIGMATGIVTPSSGASGTFTWTLANAAGKTMFALLIRPVALMNKLTVVKSVAVKDASVW